MSTDNLKIFSKWIDQPYIIKSMKKTVPIVTVGAAALYGTKDVLKHPKEERNKQAIKNILVLSLSIGSALIATNGIKLKNGKKLIKGILDHAHDSCSCKAHNCTDASHYHNHTHDDNCCKIHKDTHHAQEHNHTAENIPAKQEHDHEHHDHEHHDHDHHDHDHNPKNNKYMSFKEVADLYKKDKEKLKQIIPDSHTHTDKEMIEELKKLSILGLVPVVGGVSGGILAEKITGGDVKKESKAKIKEGTYQYLANIVLCNAGALAAHKTMKKLKIQDKTARFFGMLAGVVTFGLIFGGTVANIIGKNIINPILGEKSPQKTAKNNTEKQHDSIGTAYKKINDERKPEPLDLGLHIDDIAAVGFLSGVNWIGPVLPALYSISGYRAGIGYRNHEEKQKA